MPLDLKLLPQDYGRKFLPEGLSLESWEDIEPYFSELERKPLADAPRRNAGSSSYLNSWPLPSRNGASATSA